MRFVLLAIAIPAAVAALVLLARRWRWAPALVVGVLTVELLASAVYANVWQGGTIFTGLETGDHANLVPPVLRWPDVPQDEFLRPNAFVQTIRAQSDEQGRYLTWVPPAAFYEKGYLYAQQPHDWPALHDESRHAVLDPRRPGLQPGAARPVLDVRASHRRPVGLLQRERDQRAAARGRPPHGRALPDRARRASTRRWPAASSSARRATTSSRCTAGSHAPRPCRHGRWRTRRPRPSGRCWSPGSIPPAPRSSNVTRARRKRTGTGRGARRRRVLRDRPRARPRDGRRDGAVARRDPQQLRRGLERDGGRSAGPGPPRRRLPAGRRRRGRPPRGRAHLPRPGDRAGSRRQRGRLARFGGSSRLRVHRTPAASRRARR